MKKRYAVVADIGLEVSLKDYNILNNYPFSIVCENIEDFELLVTELMNVCNLLNEKERALKEANQEIIACHDTLVTIEALCDAVLSYDFKDVNDKVDFCHMLNEMDNKDLMFLKECFEAIKDNDLKTMSKLTSECLNYMGSDD